MFDKDCNIVAICSRRRILFFGVRDLKRGDLFRIHMFDGRLVKHVTEAKLESMLIELQAYGEFDCTIEAYKAEPKMITSILLSMNADNIQLGMVLDVMGVFVDDSDITS